MDKTTGNKNNTSDFMRVLMALKGNVMRDTNVANVCQITAITDDDIIVVPLNASTLRIHCTKLQDLTLQVNDVVLVTFTKDDFRINLKRIKASQPTQDMKTVELHSSNYGIITGLVYRNEEEE